MSLTATIMIRLLKRKIATLVLVTASMAAFATLGDGGKKEVNAPLKLNSKTFSLKTGYNYRGNNLLSPSSNRVIFVNTVVTYQKGNATYIVPLKKKVLVDQIRFKLAPLK